MAGVGFELRKLARRRGILGPVASLGHATVVAAGPWLLTVVALSLIQSRVTLESEWRSSSVQALIIYSFCLSLVATAPITVVAVRVASDHLYLKRFFALVPLFVATSLACVACGLVLALVIFAALAGMPPQELAFAALACAILSAMWPAMAFCAMVRRYGAITRAFILGLATSVALTTVAERLGTSAAVEALAFAAGLGLTTILLQANFLGAFSNVPEEAGPPRQVQRQEPLRYGIIALGALLSALALWADTWVMWLGPLRSVSGEGLATAPFYDSVMFMARISMVPALAFLIIWVETSVLDRVLAYIAAIRGTGTLDRILEEASSLQSTVRQMLTNVLLVQLVASCALALLAHTVIEASGLLFQQAGLLRNGAIGALFHLVFLAATTILLFLDRMNAFAALQGLFLLLNAGLTYLGLLLAPDTAGLGYLVAAAISATIAVLVLEATLENITVLTFEQAHRAVVAGSRAGRSDRVRPATGLARLLARNRDNPSFPPAKADASETLSQSPRGGPS
ncbi:exopolysaccharide Pel transporter PelG [Phreatobacter sp.]|uniref:exopolysaccharide Pel transporter PelG n=1 Tax=Phreatobacter sp. TaxID=1966341 RepID=UPI003F71E0FB